MQSYQAEAARLRQRPGLMLPKKEQIPGLVAISPSGNGAWPNQKSL